MKILALDLGKNTGWCTDHPTRPGQPSAGRFVLEKEGRRFGEAFAALYRHLNDLIDQHRPTHLVFEAPLQPAALAPREGKKGFTNEVTVRLLYGYAAWADGVGELRGLVVKEVNVSTAKKHFTGSGRADKDAIMRRCQLLGWAYADHNAADAIAVWSFASAMLNPKFAPETTPLFGRAKA